VFFTNQSRKKLYQDKINKLVKKFKPKELSKAQVKEINEYYASYGINNIKTSWHKLCTHVSGEFHKEYIPEDLFYNFIEPNLNMYKMHPGLTDKNLLNRIFKGIKQPETIAKNLNGVYLNGNDDSLLEIDGVIKKCLGYSKIVIKPSLDSGGGKNIVVVNLENNTPDANYAEIEKLLISYDKNFSIQSFVKQHERMNLLNPSSLNTIRVVSLLIDNEVKVLICISRIGSTGGDVDNISKGGVACRIQPNGQLSKKGYLYSTQSVLKTGSGTKLEGFEIPGFSKVNEMIQSLHKQIPYFKMISWDIAIDDKRDLVLVEYNVRSQEILGVQLFNGPLFGKYTNDVLESIKNNK